MRSFWLSVAMVFLSAIPMHAQAGKMELGITYNWMRGNAPEGGCGCFSIHGGSIEPAWRLTQRLSLVSDIGAARAAGQDLTIVSYLAGSRFYLLPKAKPESTHRSRLRPFAQLLAGGAHATGPLSGNSNGSSNSVAVRAGGGVDFVWRRHVSLRLVQAEYMLTLFPNGDKDRQNILSLSSGVVYRF